MKTSRIKILLLACGTAFGLCLGFASLPAVSPVFAAGSHAHDHDEEETHGEEVESHAEGRIILNAAQVAAAGIDVAAAESGKLAQELQVPGKVVAASDRLAQIVPRAAGVVTEVGKNLGDVVEKGEILATLESRDMADAAADYLAAQKTEELARATFLREEKLWQKKITAEQDYLAARNAHQESKIRLDLARQKLKALGVEGGVSAGGPSRFHALRAPLAGRVIARDLVLGEYVDTSRAAFVIADTSIVWVEAAIPPADAAVVREGLPATVGDKQGKVVFVSPAIDPETRAAKAVIEMDNADGALRLGAFVTAAVALTMQESALVVPKSAILTVDGAPSVFVRTADGFEKRAVRIGREDGQHAEIIDGIAAGDPVAVSNIFTLKAELGKSEAAHEH